jgi:hypothetical protein
MRVDLRMDNLTGEVQRGFAGVRAEIHSLHEADDELRRRIEAQEQRGRADRIRPRRLPGRRLPESPLDREAGAAHPALRDPAHGHRAHRPRRQPRPVVGVDHVHQLLAAEFVVEPARRQAVIRVVVHVQPQPDLLEVVGASQSPSGLAGRLMRVLGTHRREDLHETPDRT